MGKRCAVEFVESDGSARVPFHATWMRPLRPPARRAPRILPTALHLVYCAGIGRVNVVQIAV